MEQPKVRFNKNFRTVDQRIATTTNKNNVLPKQKKNEQMDICSRKSHTDKNTIKIKSIESVNFPLKVLNNGRHALDRPSNYLTPFLTSDCISPEDKFGQCSNGISTCTQTMQSLRTPNCDFESKHSSLTSESEISNNGFFMVQCSRDEELAQCCTSGLQHLTINSEVKNSDDTEKLKNNNTATVASNNSKSIRINEDNDVKNDSEELEIIKIVSNTKKLLTDKKNNKSYKLSKANSDSNARKSISFNKLSKTVGTENKENHSEKIQPTKTTNKSLPSQETNISTDLTDISVRDCRNKKKSNKLNNAKVGQVRPCASMNRTEKQVPTDQTKKQSLINFVASKTDVSVQSGSLLKMCQHETDNSLSLSKEKRSISSKNLLSRPEYNSTINVIKKLKEIKNEKVMNSENLTLACKNFINGKVSAALEFSPCESVYKDLINLTGDDIVELPMQPMRSKDPKPQSKDIVPKLINFYSPKSTGQYFTIANPAPREPDNIDIFNAFKISKKISMWKDCRDSDY